MRGTERSNKKSKPPFSLLLLLFLSSAFFTSLPSATQPVPYVIYGYVYYDSSPVEGANVTVINERTGEKLYDTTNKSGDYSIVLADMPSGWEYGDKIMVIARKGEYVGKKEVTVEEGTGNQQANIYLTPPSVADFNYTPLNPKINDTIRFYDKSTDNIVYRQWDFGDGNISNEKNPSHLYKKRGNYTVTLYIEDEFGRKDVKSVVLSVGIEKEENDTGQGGEEENKNNLYFIIIPVVLAIIVVVIIAIRILR